MNSTVRKALLALAWLGIAACAVETTEPVVELGTVSQGWDSADAGMKPSDVTDATLMRAGDVITTGTSILPPGTTTLPDPNPWGPTPRLPTTLPSIRESDPPGSGNGTDAGSRWPQ